MTNGTALKVREADPGELMHRATDVAGVCKAIVLRTAMTIQGRQYVKVEGWQSIAAAYGCVASSTNVRKVEGGVRATGELRRAADGVLVATAEGFVGEDEPTWYGGTNQYGKVLPKRADFAIMAMAQTRAISRVCRSAFAFVVILIDAKLSTTPAEEMMGVYENEPSSAPQGNVASNGAKSTEPVAAAADGPPMSPSQERLLRAKMKAAGITEEAFAAQYPHYSLTPKEGKIVVPKAEVNGVLAWIDAHKAAEEV